MKRISLVVLVVALFAVSFGVVNAQGGQRDGGRGSDRPGMSDRNRPDINTDLRQLIADELGLTVDDLSAAAQEGQTLAQVIEANGGDVQAISTTIIQTITDNINAKVADGTFTQERADEALVQVEERVTDMMNRVPGERDGKDKPGRDGVAKLVDSVVEATGLTAEELRAEFQSGKTVSDVLTENGVDIEAFSAQLITDAETHLAEQVADGTLTQEQADERLADLTEKLPEVLNGNLSRPERPAKANSV